MTTGPSGPSYCLWMSCILSVGSDIFMWSNALNVGDCKDRSAGLLWIAILMIEKSPWKQKLTCFYVDMDLWIL